MNKIEKDLKNISLFIPRFFTALSVIVAALPIIDRFLLILPSAIRYQNLATVLATIASYAIIGGDFLRRRATPTEELDKSIKDFKRALEGIKRRSPTGAFMLILGVFLTIGYVGYTDYLLSTTKQTNSVQEMLCLLWYLIIYCVLVKGLWQMALRAYLTKDIEMQIKS